MNDGLLSIGMFSRASSVSIKSLRAYHECGVLVPARIDPASGYRSYTVDQLADATIIVRLRALDLPLEQIGRIIAARDPALTRAVLAAHRSRMEQRLVETERIVAELYADTAVVAHTPVHVRREPGAVTLRRIGHMGEEGFAAFLASAYPAILAVAARTGAQPNGPCGALYDAQIEDDSGEVVEAFVPITEPVLLAPGQDVSIGELESLESAVLVHHGAYDTIAATYRTLGAWVARHAEHSGARVREWYLVGPGDVADPLDYRTEISWPIRPGSATRPTERNQP